MSTLKSTLLVSAGIAAALGGTAVSASANTITIKPGQTLYSLAKANHTTINALTATNHIKNINLIIAGHQLDIPEQKTAPKVHKVATPKTTQTYTVQAGDNLWKIANNHGLILSDLLKLNNLHMDAIIYPGQVLQLSGTVQAHTTPVVNTPTKEISHPAPVAAPAPTSAAPKQSQASTQPAEANQASSEAVAPASAAPASNAPSSVASSQASTASSESTQPETASSAASEAPVAANESSSVTSSAASSQAPAKTEAATATQATQATSVAKPAQAATPAKPAVQNTSAKADAGSDTYTVKAGDSIWKIANDNGVTLNTLLALNNLDKSSTLAVGQTLKISGEVVTPTSQAASKPASQAAQAPTSVASSAPASQAPAAKPVQVATSTSTQTTQPKPVQVANTPATPAAPSYSTTGNTYPAGQCTWFVKNSLSWVGNYWGNASDWPSSARAAGRVVDGNATVGSVVVFAPGQMGATNYGHVGVVDRVNPDGSITISEGNYAGLAYHVRTINPSGLVFIH